MERIAQPEALWQTPEQRETGKVTYRLFVDGAWRNVEGEASWKRLPQQELTKKIEEAYFMRK